MTRKLAKNSGIATFETVFVVLSLAVIGIAGYYFLHASPKPVAPSNSKVTVAPPPVNHTSSDPYAVLSPATVPSKTPECSQPITFASNGNSGPVQCANGDLNILEWNALSAIEPSVLTLGYTPSVSQLQKALCSDANASSSDANTRNSNAIEGTVYQIAALYYGWNFSPNPSVVLANGTC